MAKISSKLKNLKVAKFSFKINFFSDLKRDYPLYKASKILDDSHFNNALPTVMFLDGYKENLVPLDDRGRRWTVDAFLSRGGYNVINVNWDKIATGNYIFDAFPNCRKVGFFLLKLL